MMTWIYLRPKKAGRLKTPSGDETPEVVLGVHRDGAPVPARVVQVDRNNPARRFLKGLDPSVWEPALGIPVARVQTLVPLLSW